jgi:D-glycero-alpha-D-manno-heptose-7-phosphate kinase
MRRAATDVLSDQKTRSVDGDAAMLDNLHFTKQLGYASREYLEKGRLDCYAKVLREHWKHKRARSSGTSNECINRWHDVGLENGAAGGKLVGAGGGGFLLFLAEDPARLRRAMANEGLNELPFRFTQRGSTTIVQESRPCSA